ncbi:ribosome recycling factor family protein [Shewanella marinintestina]|uniref:ribosome recycling factor family protein n=1 Tax=Shewanella marinintestina TaxID=190305 RepID=UPI00200C6C07|nr:ribosome recycling factor family protein [Shewanella marinintestina]MCL1146852.1 ribosome recycling factor family protein [Shewanella marinintestina]
MIERITIALPSLIHRIGREPVKLAQSVAKQWGCELKRVRRSRNWGLTGEALQVQSFTRQLKAMQLTMSKAEFAYLIKKLDAGLLNHADKLESLEDKLARFIRQEPNITLAELIHLTGCTMTEARTARFNADAW